MDIGVTVVDAVCADLLDSMSLHYLVFRAGVFSVVSTLELWQEDVIVLFLSLYPPPAPCLATQNPYTTNLHCNKCLI